MNWQWLYKNWGKVCLFTAFYMTLPLAKFFSEMDTLLFLIWLHTPLYMLHQYEEHANGHFQKYISESIFKTGDEQIPLDDRSIFWINVPLIWLIFPLFAILSHDDLRLGIWIVYATLLNALLHMVMGFVKRSYNPGLFMSFFVNIPVSLYTILLAYQKGILNVMTNWISIVVAVLIHVVIIFYVKKRISQWKKTLSKS